MVDEHLISLQPGTVIAGRYEVVKCLGAGSMGLVYACRHRELAGLLVAVKVLFPEVAQDKTAAARFRNEIFASYGVSHPNVVRAYEYLRDGDLVAYTMEFVGGGDLAERLSNPEDLIPIPQAVEILSQMCSGVQAIHDAGIVHRDLKPENILLTKEGQVKIADFGIARTGNGPKLTEHGGVVGTIDYVSPEYMLNSQVDWRSDIYALGILGYEMLTGDSPFRGDSVYATMTKRLKTDPRPPSAIRPECPPELDAIILKAMARDPLERYQSAAEVRQDLARLAPQIGARSGVTATHAGTPSSGSYVGPSLSPELSDTAELAEPLVARVRRSAAGGTSPRVDQHPGLSSRDTASGFRRVGEGEGGSSSTLAPVRFVDQAIMDPRAPVGSSDEVEDEASPQPVRMERVLASTALVLDGWSRPGAPVPPAQPVTINAGAIDEARLRNLSRVVEQVHRSIWVDVLLLVLIVLIGVGVGFTLLRVFLPDALAGRTDGVRTLDVRAVEEMYE